MSEVEYTFTEKQRKLGEIAEIVGGGTPNTSVEEYWDGDIDWYTPAELGDRRYVDSSLRKITQAGYDNSSARMLPANRTILFTSRAGIGNTAILCSSACTNQGFQSLVVGDSADVDFIYSLSDDIKRKAEIKASGSTFLEISGKRLTEIEVLAPALVEQVQIGSFFRQLDSLIALHQRERNIAISASQVASHAQKLQLTRNNLFELSDLLLILVYELLHLGQVDFFLFFKSVDVTRNVQIVIVFLDLF